MITFYIDDVPEEFLSLAREFCAINTEFVLRETIVLDMRAVSSPKDIPRFRNPKKSEDYWYSSGKNHAVLNGHIQREFAGHAITFDADSAEDILTLARKYGHRIVVRSDLSMHVLGEARLPIIGIEDMRSIVKRGG